MALVVIGTVHRSKAPARVRSGTNSLRAAAHRVSSELRMVQILSMKALAGDGLSPEVREAVGEACLLHVSSLREFFWGARKPGVGVVAADFFPSARDWEALRPAMPRSMAEEWGRVLEVLRPVTQDSSGKDERARKPYQGLAAELRGVARVFLDALPSDRAAWFAEPIA